MTTWLLIQRNGRVYKEDLRQVYDVSKNYEPYLSTRKWLTQCDKGSIFWRIREERRSGRRWPQGYGLDGDESKS